MGMLNKSGSTQRKSLLTHTPGGVEVANQVGRDEIVKQARSKTAKRQTQKTTSIRISVSTRNALNSLVILGEGDSVNALLDSLITEKLESLRPDQRRSYEIINSVASSKSEG